MPITNLLRIFQKQIFVLRATSHNWRVLDFALSGGEISGPRWRIPRRRV